MLFNLLCGCARRRLSKHWQTAWGWLSLKRMDASRSRLALPNEILDKIAFCVDSYDDLIALALTCWQLNQVIIPDHSDYRMIAIQHDMHGLWAHLADHPRFAQHVKVLHLYDPHDWTPRPRYPKRYPKRVVDVDDHGQDDDDLSTRRVMEAIKLKNMCQVLRSMTALREIVWYFSWGDFDRPARYDPKAIFRVLAECKSLTHLVLIGRHGTGHIGVDHDAGDFPLSMISNLETLAIVGEAWATRIGLTAAHISTMRLGSPMLQILDIPLSCLPPPQCHFFPQLRKLTLQSCLNQPDLMPLGVSFIEAHPTIEYLKWRPLHQAELARGSLPALTCLETTAEIATSMLLDTITPPRPLKRLVGFVADSTTLERLIKEGVKVETLETLHLVSFDELASISKLGDIFPALKSLFAPPFATPTNPNDFTRCYFSEQTWTAKALCSIPKLEIFLGGGLWATHTVLNNALLESAIPEIAKACPNLRETDSWGLDDFWGCYKRIVITRHHSRIKWTVQPPPASRPFDSIMDAFQ